jgi:deoxycytidylate deaminase
MSQETVKPLQAAINGALSASTLSGCRSQRGAAVFRGSELISVGFNHKPFPFVCSQTVGCKATCRIEAVHAEQMAINGLPRRFTDGADLLHAKTVDGVLVPSGEPSCVECSKLALEQGLAAVWLFHESGWRRYPIIEFHRLSVEFSRRTMAPLDGFRV